MATPAVVQIPRAAGRGRQPRSVEAATELREELEAHRLEALRLADLMWPLLSRLEVVAREIGPIAYQTVMALEAMLARYERRHLDPEPDLPAVAA